MITSNLLKHYWSSSFIILMLAGMVLPIRVISPVENRTELLIIAGNTLRANLSPSYQVPLVNTQILGCLDREETRNGEEYGDLGYNCNNMLFESPYCAFGCLQFWQGTFSDYCMDKYRLTNDPQDIFDDEIQHRCADYMLEEGLTYKWTTYQRCVK